MERQDLLKAFAEWQEQDKSERSILIIASEKLKDEDAYVSSQGLAGTGENIIAMFKHALKNDKTLAVLMHKAVSELRFEQVLEKCVKDNINETSEEEK